MHIRWRANRGSRNVILWEAVGGVFIKGKKYNYSIGDIHGVKRIESLFTDANNRMKAEVVCVLCGKRSIVRADSLLHSKYNSCKCCMRKANGESGSKLYSVYHNIKYRCYNTSAHEFNNYGGRGIKMCDDWIRSDGYIAFSKWAIAAGYKDGLTIDRIDVNGDYSPDNCRWITLSENVSFSNTDNRVQHRKANGGTYYIMSDDGSITTFENASKFAKDMGWNANKLRNAARKNKTYKGYTVGYIKDLHTEPQSTIEDSEELVEYGYGETPQPEAPSTDIP